MAPPRTPVPLSPARHAELCRAIDSLSKAGLLRLLRFAQDHGYGTDSNAHDLLHEALALMLDGDRCAWSTETFSRDLRGIIRSVASHRRESLKQRQQRELEYTNAQPPTSNGQEGQVDSVSRVQHIRDYFEAQGDVEAALVIDGMAQGLSMREAAETLGLSSTQYDAIRQRIRRQRGTP